MTNEDGSRPLGDESHECFCQAVANGQCWTEAAKMAGYRSGRSRQAGGKLAARHDVATRIKAIIAARERGIYI